MCIFYRVSSLHAGQPPATEGITLFPERGRCVFISPPSEETGQPMTSWPTAPIRGGTCSIAAAASPDGPGDGLCPTAGTRLGISLTCTTGPCTGGTGVVWSGGDQPAALPANVQRLIGSTVTQTGQPLSGVDVSVLTTGEPATCGSACSGALCGGVACATGTTCMQSSGALGTPTDGKCVPCS